MNAISTLNDQECRVSVISGEIILKGTLGLPAGARGIVLFAHGSGSSRHCPQTCQVAHILRQRKLATLLLDLLTQSEEAASQQGQVFPLDLQLLAERLVGAADWLRRNPLTQHLHLGYFGAGGGGSAALLAAAERPEVVRAIVSHGPWCEQVGEAALQVEVPTLLILEGEGDQAALKHLQGQKYLEILADCPYQGAKAPEKVAWLADRWFEQHLSSQPSSST